jgi:hypothetical protein
MDLRLSGLNDQARLLVGAFPSPRVTYFPGVAFRGYLGALGQMHALRLAIPKWSRLDLSNRWQDCDVATG